MAETAGQGLGPAVARRSLAGRRGLNLVVNFAAGGAALLGISQLTWILYVVAMRGGASLNWTFFTELPAPPGQGGGGIANAIWGTLQMMGIATAVGVPVGVMAGVYLNEYGHKSRFGSVVRFLVNMMMGVPSIIVGLFVFALIVMPMHSFSGYAGAAAIALLILPIVARTTEDMLYLVPNTMRESALALGAPRWRVTLGVVFPFARAGLLTGALLAVARVSGETAPLLFTALNSPFWSDSLANPTANLTVTIFNFAMSPYKDWQQDAWGASLLITAAVLFMTIVARFILKGKKQ